MKRLGGKPVDMRTFECPQCKKLRMVRLPTHVVSTETREYKSRDGSAVTLLIDVCDHCRAKNYRKYFEPSQADVRRIIKAIKEEKQIEGQSLEDLL